MLIAKRWFVVAAGRSAAFTVGGDVLRVGMHGIAVAGRRVAARPTLGVPELMAKVTDPVLQHRSEIWHGADDHLRIPNGQYDISPLNAARRCSGRTPTLNSTVPQRTSIVEFPSPYAIVWICVRRMTEQNVVKNPSRNRQITPAL